MTNHNTYPNTTDLLPPSTDLQDVLLHIVKHGEVSCKNFPILQGYRTRVSELRMQGILFSDIQIEGEKNRHGHPKPIVLHKCLNISEALRLYKQLTEK